MADTLDALVTHLTQTYGPTKTVIWAHNSHLGDARATEMGRRGGEINLGQLVRERHAGAAYNIGFSTYHGTVTAANNWDEPAQRKTVRPGLPDSYEDLFHAVGLDNFYLSMREGGKAVDGLRQARLQRAIGVIYRPETERQSHYFHAILPEQFDAIIHMDHTRALEPLERNARWVKGDLPETYPSGV
jgi:erythromycin esterase-like protein